MADVNYLNPESLNPFKTGGTSNPTDGGAGAPQSFMEAMALPQRQQDYQQALGLSMQSSQLANQKQGAELQDYLANTGNRQLSRDLLQRQLTTQNTLQPIQSQIEGQNLAGDLEAGKSENVLKVQKALNSVPEEQRRAHLNEYQTASTLLRGMPDNYDTGLALQTLSHAGVDTSHFKGMNDADTRHRLKFLRDMNPEAFKYLREAQIKEMEMKTQERIHAGNNATSRYVADKMAEYRTQLLKNNPTARNNEMDAHAQQIMTKPVQDWDAEDHAFMAVWKTRTLEPFNKAGAAAVGAGDKVKQAIGAIQEIGKGATPGTPNNNPQYGQPKSRGTLENPTEEQYNQLKDGDTYTYQGKTYTKGKK